MALQEMGWDLGGAAAGRPASVPKQQVLGSVHTEALAIARFQRTEIHTGVPCLYRSWVALEAVERGAQVGAVAEGRFSLLQIRA